MQARHCRGYLRSSRAFHRTSNCENGTHPRPISITSWRACGGPDGTANGREDQLTCASIVGWVNRYGRKKRTRKSVPEPDWMAGTMGPAQYEFAPLQGYGLGLIAGIDRATGHHLGCRLRR